MGIPAQIQRQLEAAEALQASLSAAPAPAEPAPAPAEPVEPTPEPQPEPVAAAAPAPQASSADELTWEQRYRSLQGMWQSQKGVMAQYEQQVRSLTERLDQATAKISEMAKPDAQAEQKLVTDKDAEAFGPELIELARRVAREEFGPERSQFQARIAELERTVAVQNQKLGGVEQSTEKLSAATFYRDLDRALPQWETIQATPECQAWLVSRIPGQRGRTWHDSLQAAASEFNSDDAAEVFEAFLAAHPKLDPRRAPEPTQPKPNAQRQVAPSKTSASAPAPAESTVYTPAEYEAAMMQMVRLNKERKYDEAAALEAALNAAVAEGRVRP